MNRELENSKRFEESIRRVITDAEIAPSPELWSRVASSAKGGGALFSLSSNLVRWGSVVAASLLLGFAATVWLTSRSTIESQQEAIFAQIEELPIAPEVEPTSTSLALDSSENQYVVEEKEPIQRTPTTILEQDDVRIVAEGSAENSAEVEVAEDSAPAPAEKAKGEPTDGGFTQVTLSNMVAHEPRATSHSNKFKVGLMAAGGAHSSTGSVAAIPISTLMGEPIPMRVPMDDIETISNFNRYSSESIDHHAPIKAALSVDYALDDRWSIGSGLSYSYLYSEISDSRTDSSLKQVVQLLGVPLRLNYEIYSSQIFTLYTGAGGMIERTLSSRISSRDVDEKEWHWSVEGVLGAQYNINNWLGIYLEPEVVYYLTPTILSTIRTESPLSVNMRFGLRFSLGK